MKIGVIGIGTAGIMSLCHALKWLCPEGSTVTSIYDPKVKILSVGETMDPGFVNMLFESTDFNYVNDGHELDAMIKLGVGWKNWREHDFAVSMSPPLYAINFNNGKLKDFCFKRFETKWKDKFQKLEGNVTNLEKVNNQAQVTIDGNIHNFDFIIDCRGYPEDYSDYNVVDNLVNHVLVHVVKEPGTTYTPLVRAHENGWMFHIPLTTRQAWGYLYNDNITSREDAVSHIKELFNKDEVNLNEFKFKSYYAKSFFDGCIMKNGNRASFFEPIEGIAGFFYLLVMKSLVDYVEGNTSVEDINENLTKFAKYNELFIYYAYHGGSKYDTEYWKITKEKANAKLQEMDWPSIVNEINEAIKTKGIDRYNTLYGWSTYHWTEWDRNFEYNYFKE